MREKIEKFVDEVIKNNDYQLLDILWIFSYSEPSRSAYHDKELFKKWFGYVCERNLQRKYNLTNVETKGKLKIFIDFLNNTFNFPSKDIFYQDDKLLREVLINKSIKILVQNIKNKIQVLSDLEKKILSFVLNYIPLRIQSSIKTAEEYRNKNPNSAEKYGSMDDFCIILNKETGDIDYFIITDIREWRDTFNSIFNEELKERRLKIKSGKRDAGFIILPSKQYDEYSFCQLGDELVKIGIGYWVFYISSRKYPTPQFIIPSLIYENIKNHKESLPIVETFIEKIKEKGMEKEWGLEEPKLENHDDIVEYIIANPECLEEGLEFVGKKEKINGDEIDILCKDKNENFVVVEVKSGKGGYEVVGQIQKYMVGIEKRAKDKKVRGIIIVKERDPGLEKALEGSKFSDKIDIKTIEQILKNSEMLR